MNVQFGETKTVHENIPPSRVVDGLSVPWGCYSLPNPISWYSCRETIAEKISDTDNGFYFSIEHNNEVNIASFLLKTELILGLVNNLPDQTLFAKTTRPHALWIEPATFWRKCRFRFSLFTILCRSASKYREADDNYEQALFSDAYAKETQLAVKRFLFGHTQFVWEAEGPQPIYDKYAWRDYFHNKSVDVVRKKLVMPADAIAPRSVIGAGSIWN